ncbi:ferredoxin-type protein NapH [Selenomonas sp. GACV-9]|uniref:4Fe-4S binding protein n=1 Tax=Selenomonas sp. GACV-9 TaxID=3158782 RepID=UPI0008F182A2|nr:ferredoxin-type protein NapH [Selenomonas ruminantium]
MKNKKKYIRRLIQLAAIGWLFPPVYFLGTVWVGTYISADFLGVGLTDPLSVLEITLAGKSIWPALWLSAVPLVVLALLLGRVFCSYICPLNFLLELLPRRQERQLVRKTLPIGIAVMVLLLSLVLAVPVNNTISPVFSLLRVLLFGWGSELLLVALVLLAALVWGQKIWCRALCPLGAVYGLLGIKRRLFLQVDAKRCVRCGKCRAACSMGTYPGSGNWKESYLCTNCGDCIDACDKQAIRFTWRGRGEDALGEGK